MEACDGMRLKHDWGLGMGRLDVEVKSGRGVNAITGLQYSAHHEGMGMEWKKPRMW